MTVVRLLVSRFPAHAFSVHNARVSRATSVTPVTRVTRRSHSVPAAPRARAGLVGIGALAWLLTAAMAGTPLVAAQPTMTVWNRVYSKAQASRGEEAYKSACGYCHKDDLSGGFMDDGVGRAPALAGPQAFGSSLVERFRDQTLGDMVYAIASTMPKQAPTSLPLDTYVDIVAYLLERNGVPAGADELPGDVLALRDVAITPPK